MTTKRFFIPIEFAEKRLVVYPEDMTDEERAFLHNPCDKNYTALENSFIRKLEKARM